MKTKIALLLIVKNEAHIIHECLEGVYKFIDYWVISDTGSTDNTCEIITDFFKKVNIPGELHHDKWVDFDHNRTLNFIHCEKGKAAKICNYMWVIDADDKVVGDFRVPEKFNDDEALLIYQSGNMKYSRPQLFKIGLDWEYEGVIHETAIPRSKTRVKRGKIEGNYHIESRRMGDRTLNPLKYYKDGIRLWKDYDKLKAELDGLKSLPKLGQAQKTRLDKLTRLTVRYTFYMGQSFRDYGDVEYSEKWYRERSKIQYNKYDEECYQACLELAHIMRNRNMESREKGETPDDDELCRLYEVAYEKYPFVAEPYYSLAVYFNKYDEYEKALKYGEKAYAIPYPENAAMFVVKDIYEYKCGKEYAYSLHKCGKLFESYNISEGLLVANRVPQSEIVYIENIRNMNMKIEMVNVVKTFPGNVVSNIRVTPAAKCTCIVKYTTFANTCASINSFLKCVKDINMIGEWIVYGSEPQPLFEKLYKFIKYVQVDSIDIFNTQYPYVIHFIGNTIWIYIDEYIKRGIGLLSDINGVFLTFIKGEVVDIGGVKYNKCPMNIDHPIIMNKNLCDDDIVLSLRINSCLELGL